MATSRILVSHNNLLYRFLLLEQSSDGGVIVAVDRDKSVSTDGRALVDGKFVPAQSWRNATIAHARWTVHTSGIINYRHAKKAPTTQRIEPLYALTKNWLIGWVSVPKPSRLTSLGQSREQEVQGVITLPTAFTNRFTIGILVCPGSPSFEEGTWWVALNFETYSIAFTSVPLPIEIPPDMSEHFVYGGIGLAPDALKGVGAAEAEIKFYERTHGPGPKVFREVSGAYVVLTDVEMASPPTLHVTFSRDDLSFEIIRSEKQPSHKVRFWILDKGGRNKVDDLRPHIVLVELEAGF